MSIIVLKKDAEMSQNECWLHYNKFCREKKEQFHITIVDIFISFCSCTTFSISHPPKWFIFIHWTKSIVNSDSLLVIFFARATVLSLFAILMLYDGVFVFAEAGWSIFIYRCRTATLSFPSNFYFRWSSCRLSVVFPNGRIFEKYGRII